MSTALLEARPAKAAWSAWAPVSASPGMVDCTSSTSALARRISSASRVRSWTPAVDAPCGGETVTARKFSPPASMKAVGSSGASAMATRKSDGGDAQRAPLGDAVAQRQHEHRRVEPLPDGHLRLAVGSELHGGPVDEPVGQHRDDREGHEQRGQQGEGDGQAEGQEELADDAAHEAEGQEDGHGRDGRAGDGAGDLPGAGEDRGLPSSPRPRWR